MIIEALGRKYQIGFSHDAPIRDEKGNQVKCTRCTECYITELIELDDRRARQIVSQGLAMCNKQDQFNRDRGRKLALTRALAKIFPHIEGTEGDMFREVRRMFWHVYLNRKAK